MSSNSNCHFVLERIGVPHTIIFDKPDHTYTCGRAKDNEIVCLSLTVSRHHCIFFYSKNELYVTDLKSSNGLFINGVTQKPLQTHKLQPNDVIGIGCADVDTTDNSMFVYKLHAITQPNSVENDHSTTALSETILNVENMASDKFDYLIKRKREQSNNDAKVLPSKIPKLESQNCILIKPEGKSKIQDENDIEIIHVSLNNSLLNPNDKNSDNCIREVQSDTRLNKHKEDNMFKSSSAPKNLKTELLSYHNDSKMESNEINSKNVESFVSSIARTNTSKKEATICESKRGSNINRFLEVQSNYESKLLHTEDVENTANNFCNFASKNTEGTNKINLEINLEGKANCTSEQDIQRNSEINNITNTVEKSIDTVVDKASNKADKDMLSLPPNFICNEDGVIKMEEELQLTDTDEDAMCDSPNLNVLPLVSPIKLKKVQQEPKTKFSEDDVVNLSDSEDDIFPCSQLFDIGFGMNTSIKEEIKEEPVEQENERFSILEDDDLVISLSDSEDEDNNWLHRLSRSQILNDDDEIDGESKDNIKKVDDLDVEIIDDGKPIVNKVLVKTEIDEDKEKKATNREEEASLQGVKNLNKLFAAEISLERMEVDLEDQIEKSTEISSVVSDVTKKCSISPKNQSLQKEAEALIDDTSGKTEKVEKVSKKKKSLDKKVPQIEAPHLPTRRRSVSSNRVQQDSSAKTDKPEKASKQRLSAKERKEQQEKLKLEQYYRAKEQKHRKMLHKWAVDCLPPSKKKEASLSKEEKKALANDRKMKLKQIAMEKKRTSLEGDKEKKRIVSKPKAKITTKTRNDFLVEETISLSKPEDNTEKSKASSSSRSAAVNSSSENLKAVESTKSKDASTEISTHLRNKLVLNDISSLGRIPKKSSSAKAKVTTAVAEEALKDLSLEKDVESKNKSSAKSSSKTVGLPPLHLKSNLKSPMAKSKKRVSFSTVIKTVREYEIDESNVLKKLTGKDAPIPREKVVARPRTTAEPNAKYDAFLLRIFLWNPVWLEEQLHLNTTAPVIHSDEFNVMLTYYRSYEEYYNIISPLLLLEIWHGITKEFQNIDQNFRRPTFMCSIVENSIQTNMVSQNVYFATLMLEVLATKEDMDRQTHPRFGDLVFFEFAYNHEKGQAFRKVFAFVTNVHTTVLSPLTRFNKDLLQYVKKPCTLLTYTMITRPLVKNILVNRVQRLRTVTYLRSNLRMVRALQYLPNSPLVNLILSPKLEMYKLPTVTEPESMVTGDALNQKQMDVVCKITTAVVQKVAKLCCIQGPPGTGKSKVIVNIVTQILYGNNRYTNNGSSSKILVCAPSNAAIDEIVLRLLDIRQNIKQRAKMKPFKMVRIGMSEMMHPTVKNISVTELAKRDMIKTAASSNSIPPESIENEKLLLDSKMNAIKCELTTSRNIDETYKQHLRMKLADMTAKYELLKSRKPLNEINNRERVKLQRYAENKILEHADIITCTLSSCCTNQMESIFGTNKRRISVCIVDEATQSCEAETLIPLMLGINILVLVGDPMQLPATILSPEAKRYGLEQSLFSRIQNAFDLQPKSPIIMLDTQYRMQQEILSWPNKFFYGGKLKNAVERNNKFPFYPYRILNVNTNQNSDNFSNDDEANFVANIVYCMLTFANLDNWESCISYGILTPYNNQKSIISKKINEKTASLPENVRKKMKIEVNTVDGFQGQERDVIIISCVRSEKIGFFSDKQRLCVALTRAKHSLILCGNFNVFMRDAMWNSLLSDARLRKAFFNVNTNAEPHEIKSFVVKRMVKK